MLKNKTIQVFDTENIKEGYIISFNVIRYEENIKTEELEPYISSQVNGIVYSVDETFIQFVDKTGNVSSIEVNSVINGTIEIVGCVRMARN